MGFFKKAAQVIGGAAAIVATGVAAGVVIWHELEEEQARLQALYNRLRERSDIGDLPALRGDVLALDDEDFLTMLNWLHAASAKAEDELSRLSYTPGPATITQERAVASATLHLTGTKQLERSMRELRVDSVAAAPAMSAD